MRWYELAQQLDPALRKGEVDSCILKTIQVMSNIPESPFHLVTELNFTNSLDEVASYIETFIKYSKQKFDLKAIYTETNGFDINPREWFFDLFGYASYGGLEDFDWLSDWQVETTLKCTLTGMEELQKVYASSAFSNERYCTASDFSSLLVVLKFQQLIQQAARKVTSLDVPLLATSHDYDFIFEYRPGA